MWTHWGTDPGLICGHGHTVRFQVTLPFKVISSRNSINFFSFLSPPTLSFLSLFYFLPSLLQIFKTYGDKYVPEQFLFDPLSLQLCTLGAFTLLYRHRHHPSLEFLSSCRTETVLIRHWNPMLPSPSPDSHPSILNLTLTPVLLPGKSHGRRSLVGCRSWGR